jgi:hypothetical protein
LALHFGESNLIIDGPAIMHPLKDKPLVTAENRYLCPSIPLLDYSLDRIFSKVLTSANKTREKYQKHRHEFLLEKGLSYLSGILRPLQMYKNLRYPNGEMDGLLMLDNHIIFVEAKGHKISDRAKEGYMERITKDIKDVMKGSYDQALRTHDYLIGKANVPFFDEQGKKNLINGTGFQHVYFISLLLEDFSAITCNLKVNNSLRLFTSDTFPWIVSLYDLRAICEHLEGPSYLLHYLQRRREFFRYEKFIVQDELDILGYYLERNLDFEYLMKQYDKSTGILLDTWSTYFTNYYQYLEGKKKKFVPQKKHYASVPFKKLIKALEDSSLPFSLDAAVLLLESDKAGKRTLMSFIEPLKKRYIKNTKHHDCRIAGIGPGGQTWMFSYWVGPNNEDLTDFFSYWVQQKFKTDPCSTYIAVFDNGKTNYQISKVIKHEQEKAL